MNSNLDIQNLYLDGGGIFGFCLCGSLQILKDYQLINNVKNILGVSVGGLIALMLCLSYTIDEIYTFSFHIDLVKLINLQENSLSNIMIQFGFDSGDKFIKILKMIIRKKMGKENVTFLELFQKTGKKLILVGSNLTTRRHDILNHENTPDMYLWQGVRITCGFPLLFKPYIYQGYHYVDGGNSKYNANYFNDFQKTIGINLEISQNFLFPNDSLEQVILNMMYLPFKNLRYLNYNRDNSIEIDTGSLDLNCIDFKISDYIKKKLYYLGKTQTLNQIDKLIENLKKKGNIIPKKKYRDQGTQT